MAAVHLGGKVLVLTVDPARRLADALGLEAHRQRRDAGCPPRRSPPPASKPRGELWAAMLDTKAVWDDLIRRHAPDAQTRDAILANPLYQNITGRFVQSHDYIAMERLHELHASGRYDLIVVDTPPTRNALDFLDAPERMAEFFGSRLLRWLTVPVPQSRSSTLASKPFYPVADRILGLAVPAGHRRVLRPLPGDGEGLRQPGPRGRAQLLGDPRTTFFVVTTLETAPAHEAGFFVRRAAAAQAAPRRGGR